MPELGVFLTRIFPHNDRILSLCRRIRIRENPYCRIFYAVNCLLFSSVSCEQNKLKAWDPRIRIFWKMLDNLLDFFRQKLNSGLWFSILFVVFVFVLFLSMKYLKRLRLYFSLRSPTIVCCESKNFWNLSLWIARTTVLELIFLKKDYFEHI